MSKTRSINANSTNNDRLISGANTDSENPLSDLIAEFDDIERAPAFKSLKAEVSTNKSQAPLPRHDDESTLEAEDEEEDYSSVFGVNHGSQAVAPSAEQFQTAKASEDVSKLDNDAFDRPVAEEIHQPRANAQDSDEDINIPERNHISTAAAIIGGTMSQPEQPRQQSPEKRRNKRSGLMIAAAALLAFGGAGYLYVQGSQTASSETVVYEAPIFDDEIASTPAQSITIETPPQNPVTSVVDSTAPSSAQEQIVDEAPEVIAAVAPTPAALPIDPPAKPKPLGFDDKFSNEFPELEGQSLLDLATGVATFAPAATVPATEWTDVSCAGCHSFNQANLCEQGAYYFNHDQTRITRIQHPYGGGFKTKLMEWAEGGCK